jgi:hypothetical protein
MKSRLIAFMIAVFIFTLFVIPAGLNASTSEAVENGDFENNFAGWFDKFGSNSVETDSDGNHYLSLTSTYIETANAEASTVYQTINGINNPDATFSYSFFPLALSDTFAGSITVSFIFSGSYEFYFSDYYYTSSQLTSPVSWNHVSYNALDRWNSIYPGQDFPKFNTLEISLAVWGGFGDPAGSGTIFFDDISFPNKSSNNSKQAESELQAWVRTQEMTCKQVWVNEDNKFQFSFIYPYADNNWVRIYDMAGNMVYEIDMPYDNPNIIVDLPNGTYTVKTFTAGSPEPIQTFVIGK